MLTAMIFSNLTRVSHELKAEPQLAHTWEANEDSSEWTFHLVKNAKFTNGRTVTAHDVKFSFERILDPETASRGRKAMGPIDTITAADDHTLVIKLKGPYADLPLQLGNTFARVIAKENLEEISHNPIGSGPFILKEYIPGNKAILVKNPDYFEEGLPYLEEVHQIYIKEYAAQVSALTTGEIDIMYFAPSEIIKQLEADPNIEVRITPAPSFQPLVMFVEKSPLRRCPRAPGVALRARPRGHARSRHRRPRFARQRHPPWVRPTPTTTRPCRSAPATWRRRRSCWPRPATRTAWTSRCSPPPGGRDWSRPPSSPNRTCWKRVSTRPSRASRSPGCTRTSCAAPADNRISHNNWFGRPTIDETLTPFFTTKANWNYTGYSNPEVDELLARARSLIDFDTRKKLYDRVQEIPLPRRPDGGAVLQELCLRGAQGGQELQADPRPVRGSARHLGREVDESGPVPGRGRRVPPPPPVQDRRTSRGGRRQDRPGTAPGQPSHSPCSDT